MPPAKTPRKTPIRKRAPAAKKTTVASPTPSVRHATVQRTYIFAVGRRKEAVARVRWFPDQDVKFVVNDRPANEFFPGAELGQLVNAPLVLTHHESKGAITVKVAGGGVQGQAEAVRLGIARALVRMDPDLRLPLKRAGFLRRDPRVKERKKYGLKRARRAPQWQKR